MLGRTVAILDIGSSAMTVLIGERGINQTFSIRGKGDADYSGFCDGEFFDESELKYAVKLAISNAEASSGEQVENLYVGVPAEFLYVECKTAQISFVKRKRIDNNDITVLNNRAVDNKLFDKFTLLNCSPVYYILDDNIKTLKAKGQKSTRLSGYISVNYVENAFIALFNKILEGLNIKSVEYVSSPLAESQYVLDEEKRDKVAILVDSGYITTSVSLVQGEGLLLLNSFSLGGGHITADLSECLNMKFQDAENLKKEIILSINAKRTDNYEIITKDKILSIPMHTANEVAISRLEMMCALINKCIKLYNREFPAFTPIYLTGSGLSYIKGVKEYLIRNLGRNVEIIAPNLPQMNKPHLSSLLGLLNYALNKEEENRGSLIDKFVKKIHTIKG